MSVALVRYEIARTPRGQILPGASLQCADQYLFSGRAAKTDETGFRDGAVFLGAALFCGVNFARGVRPNGGVCSGTARSDA